MSMCICDLLNYINDLLLPTVITDMMYSYRYLVHPLSNFYCHFRPILLYGHVYCIFLEFLFCTRFHRFFCKVKILPCNYMVTYFSDILNFEEKF